MKVRSLVLLLSLMMWWGVSFSQTRIKGRVVDSTSGEALAFVNIIFNNNPQLGTITDIDGKFQFSSGLPLQSMKLSYVGYESKYIELGDVAPQKTLIIHLKHSSVKLQEVVVKPGVNPAHRIIKKAVENKKINHPENIDYFKYTSYNKSIYDFIYDDSLDTDSIEMIVQNAFGNGHLFVMESVAERKYIHPGLSEEVILGAKVSGFKHPSFAPLATDLQPFSFYDDLIPIIDINYLNPISNGSINKYHFELKDTLYQGADSVFVISFKPKEGKNYEGLTGLLYINTYKYAIQNVIAEPYEKGFIDVKIQQKYQLVDGQQWFPEQLNYEFQLVNYPSDKVGIMVNGRSYIKDVVLDSVLDKSGFYVEAIRMHDDATERDSTFWEEHRVELLNKEEKTTYKVLDSLGEEHNFDGFLRFMEKVARARIPIGFIDLDLNQTLVYNEYEGYRMGFGIHTNERVSKVFSIGGFFGYGEDDHQWKYGGELTIDIEPEHEVELNLQHLNTLREVGNSSLDFFSNNSYDMRGYLAYRMDHIVQNSFSLGFRAFRYAKMNFGLHHSIVVPKYIYYFEAEKITKNHAYTNSEFSYNLRFAFREKLINTLNQRVSMGTDYPVFYLAYSRGINGLYESDLEYNKIELGLEKSFLWRSLGESRIRINAGMVDENLPYGLLFSGEGSFNKDIPYVVKNHFQTMKPYEFLSDRYVDFFFSHSFKSLLLQLDGFKPKITVSQNIGFGKLKQQNTHQNISFSTKEKGFFESGLLVDDLLRINYLNIGYMGFGIGAYYRLGPYAYAEFEDNVAIKFSVTFSSR